MSLNLKLKKLEVSIKACKKILVALSGGVDSAFILKKAVDYLGADNVKALLVSNGLCPLSQIDEAKQFAAELGVDLKIIESEILLDEEFVSNPRNKCYICKTKIFAHCREYAREQKISHICDGTNADDSARERPGMKAAIEARVKHPLRTAKLTKAEIREYAKESGISFWNKPSFSCYATRIEAGIRLDPTDLFLVEEGEKILREAGLEVVRLRLIEGGDTACIVLGPEDHPRFFKDEVREVCTERLQLLGFRKVKLDTVPYGIK